MKQSGATDISIVQYKTGNCIDANDLVAVEAPLLIRLTIENKNGRLTKSIAVTLRTPGQDNALAMGYLFSEGIISQQDHILSLESTPSETDGITITMEGDFEKLHEISQRNNAMYAACGVCGKTEFDTIDTIFPRSFNYKEPLNPEIILGLPEKMVPFQSLFEKTGGIHAAGIFDINGLPELVMEDIGRHNAVDKAIGHYLLQKALPLSDKILVLSGRAGYELVQKAAMAGIGMVVSVGAPSSMSIETAKDAGITLIGFVKKNNFNIYTHPNRILS